MIRMNPSGESPRAQVRILGVVAAAELSVGGFAADALPDRIAALCGVDAAAGARGVASGRSLLDSMGLGALVIDPGLAGEIVGVLGSRGPGAAAEWARSLEDRGGTTPGTRLSLLVSVLRGAAHFEAPGVTPKGSAEPRAVSPADHRASTRTDVRDEAPRDLESPSHRVRPTSAFDSAHESREPELTFDDDFSGLSSGELIPRADDDLGLGGPIDLSDDLRGDADLGH